MKPIKLFSTLKSGVGAAALAIAAFAFLSCQNMTTPPAATMVATASKTLYPPTFPEHTTDNEGNPIAVTYAERYYTVSQGQKNKITISWNKVEIAKYYEVWAAQNLNDNFVKVGEPTSAQFEDSVGAGVTYYYKVRAVNSKGAFSDFSSVVKGTSLAKPAITDIKITDTSASVFWYMGNVGIDSYVKNLVYEVRAINGNEEKVTTIKAWDEANQRIVEEYTFENLNGHTDYKFRIDAYITSDQNSVEKSPEVTKETLALYTPVSPEFTASQGESTQHVKLFIKLPAKIQVQTSSGGAPAQDEDYPLCFEVHRKRSNEDRWTKIASPLYYTGKTEKPSGDKSYDAYKEGSIVEYDDESAIRGAKYDYRIISCVDINYSLVKGFDYKAYTASKESTANTAQGWAAAVPTFSTKNYKRILSDDKTKVESVSHGFDVSWNDLGKAADYKFAIEYERSYNNGASTETDWLLNSRLAIIMDSMDEVRSFTKEYDVKNNAANIEGAYTYTLYVFPAKYVDPSKIKGDYLVKVKAQNLISVSQTATEPNRDLKAEGGWTDHTLLTWTVEDGVDYTINWTKYDKDDNEVFSGVIPADDLKDSQGQYTGRYEHNPLEGGYKYNYAIIANNSTPGNTDGSIPSAKTLGTPAINFEANSYTTITASWRQVIAAEKYEVTLGSAGAFGNGATFTVDTAGVATNIPDGLDVTTSYDDPTKTISITINKPYGYNDATLSGKAVPLKITAMSGLDEQNAIKGISPATKDVWTIGPASINLEGSESCATLETTSIKISWKKLQGAKGYAIYRRRPQMTMNTNADGSLAKKDESYDIYYVNESGTAVSPSNASIETSDDGTTFTLTDIYKKAASNDTPALNQQYLALGIPFTYTVLPVLEESLNDIAEISQISDLKYPAAGDAYKNIANVQKDGYTVGYGIALEATKAEYSDRVELTWEMPESAKNKNAKPNIYWRKKGSNGAWTKISMSINANVNKVDIIPSDKILIDRVQALEYAVTYSDSMDSSAAEGKDAAYVSYQAGLKNLKITDKETKCVGYMFTMPQIEPVKQDTNTEDIKESLTWYFYDKDGNRAVGGSDITQYELGLKNLNCSGKWWTIYTYDAAGGNETAGHEDWYDCAFSTSTSGMQVDVDITPIFKTNAGTYHDGLLKVQRDYKHYYRISAKRFNSQGEEITATSEDYAYRKIEKDEAKKCINLIIADAMHQAGVGTSTSVNTDANTSVGNFTLTHKTGGGIFADGKCKISTGQGGYQHTFPRTPGEQEKPLKSGWNITANSDYGGAIGSSVFTGTFLKKIPETAVTYTHETGLNSYTGNYAIKDNCDGETWFPYLFNDKDHSGPDSTLNTSLPMYKGLWWEPRQGGKD